jgi:hypothetical protein
MSTPDRIDWKLYVALIVLTTIVVLQNTKQAMLPAKQTPLLWTAEITVLVCVLILRSGWGRDSGWAKAQEELGTLANNFYAPRRETISNSFAIGLGVLLSLWWAAATWAVMFNGMRRNVAGRGLADFEVAALVGAIAGGAIGAVCGLVVGHIWETRHRRRRLATRAHHA